MFKNLLLFVLAFISLSSRAANHKYAARNVYVFETLSNSFLADVDGSPMQMTVPAYDFMAPVSSNGTSVNVRFRINDDLRTVTLVGGVAYGYSPDDANGTWLCRMAAPGTKYFFSETPVYYSEICNDYGCQYDLRGDVVIPQTVTDPATGKSYTVTGLDEAALCNQAVREQSILSLTLPATVTYIGLMSFLETRIEDLDFSQIPGLTEIGAVAFTCSWLKQVDLSPCEQLTTIGAHAFNGCQYMSEAYMTGCSSLKTIDYGAFQTCNSLEEVDMTGCENLLEVKDYAFSDNRFITKVVWPSDELENDMRLGKAVFWKDFSLKKMSLPEGVVSIGMGTFYDCVRLEEVVLPSTLAAIPRWTFGLSSDSYYSSLRSITINHDDATRTLTSSLSKEVDSNNDIFKNLLGEEKAKIVVYVPERNLPAYKEDSQWNGCIVSMPMTVNKKGVSTFCYNYRLTLQEPDANRAYWSDVEGSPKAYKVLSDYVQQEGDVFTVTSVKVNEFAGDEGVMIKGEPDTKARVYSKPNTITPNAGNMMVGTVTPLNNLPRIDGDYANFFLSDGVFYPVAASNKLAANRAYLRLPKQILERSSQAKVVFFWDDGEATLDEVTGISMIGAAQSLSKGVYTLQGVKVAETVDDKSLPHGIYIYNGKKIRL